jgi:peptidoglycan L-alanyl-D-glutamate endopeptidase CwlK
MDKITEKRIETLHPKLREMVREIYQKINENLVNKNIICRFTSTYRTAKEQNDLYAQGRTATGNVVTMAKAGQSYHNYGMAIDVCLIKNGVEASWDFTKDYDNDGIADLMEVIHIFQMYGWEWAGTWKTFKEKPHIQYTFGKSIIELQKMPTFLQDNIQYPVI